MKLPKIKDSDVTDSNHYLNRKSFIKKTALAAAGILMPAAYYVWARQNGVKARPGSMQAGLELAQNGAHPERFNERLELYPKGSTNYAKGETITEYEYATGYNNFYEFSTDKEDVAKKAGSLKPRPWSITIDGEVENRGNYHFEDLIKMNDLEERIYRFRCVEGWSMVIPWIGIELRKIIQRVKPNSFARFVKFTTLYDPEQMPGQKRRVLIWPYVEGLRLDEANHPLTLLAAGMYGKTLPNQNGAPLRLIVPWKYGFKSIKSIVRITFTREQPVNTWNAMNPIEYGFYSNVNPHVDHPRWSQAMERRIGEYKKVETLMFNGYAEQVGSMYQNMDLQKYY